MPPERSSYEENICGKDDKFASAANLTTVVYCKKERIFCVAYFFMLWMRVERKNTLKHLFQIIKRHCKYLCTFLFYVGFYFYFSILCLK